MLLLFTGNFSEVTCFLPSYSNGSDKGCSSQGRSSACSPSFTSSTMVDILFSLLISYPVTASVDTFCRIHPIRTGYIQQYIQCTHVSIISPWRISSNAIKQRAFLNRLPNYSYQPLGLPLAKLIIYPGPSGIAAVLKGKFACFQPHFLLSLNS